MSQQPGRHRASVARPLLFVVILVLVLVSVSLVIVSPLALRSLDDGGQDWSRLSAIGQTYGAVSAIIAAIALVGVMISLIIQSREARAARQAAQRGHLFELLRMAMDDPRFMECWGPYLTKNFATEGQFAYINLIVAHWHAEYMVRQMPDRLLRPTAASVFASAPGRTYWENTGTFWRDNYSGRQARRFYEVLEATYQDAIKRPPSVPPPEQPERAGSPITGEDKSSPDLYLTIAASVGVGAVLALAIRRALHK